MPFTDADILLQPISPTEMAGTNLEYDPEFAELERAVQGKPEQQIGSSISPAEEPDWNLVLKVGLSLFGRSKDLRVAGHIAQALARRHGFEGLDEGLLLVSGLLERYWDVLHPLLDPDDGNDPAIRANALSSLGDGVLLTSLRSAPLIRSRSFGGIGLRQIAIASGEVDTGTGAKVDGATIDAAFQDATVEQMELTLAAIQRSSQHVAAIDKTFDDRANGGGPDLVRLVALLAQAEQTLGVRLRKRKAKEAGEAEPDQVDGQGGGETTSPAFRSGEINSRDAVLRTLEKIEEYYARHEPSSPIPLLLQRCKRLVPMKFIDIVRDMAPDGLSQVELVVGKQESV